MSGGMVEVEPPIIAITGGRDRVPRLSELEAFEKLLPDARIVLRHGKARGTDQFVGSWARVRCSYCTIEEWPADTKLYGPWPRAGHVRNHAMLVGKPGYELVSRGHASRLIAFAGGPGTANCVANAGKLGIPISHIAPALEPQVINRHHFRKIHDIPSPWTYVGRGTPLGNPFTVADHGQEAIAKYRRYLWEKMKAKDRAVLDALEQITPEHGLVCSCWPRPCHADVIIHAWLHLRRTAAVPER